MVYNEGRYHSVMESFVLIDQQIKIVSNFKYLSYLLIFDLDDENYINSKLNSFYLLNSLFNLMYRFYCVFLIHFARHSLVYYSGFLLIFLRTSILESL